MLVTERSQGRTGQTASLTNEAVVLEYQQTLDTRTLDRLLERNRGLLHHVLKRFAYAHDPYEDLFQVARLGLIKAAQRYEPDKAGSFSTYAVAVVDGEIRHYLRDNLLVRQPRWARSLYLRIQQAQRDFYRVEGRSLSMRELAKAVNLQEEGVLEIIRVNGALSLHSLDEPFTSDYTDLQPDRRLMRSLYREPFALPIEDRILLYQAVRMLSDLHKRIIYLMFFKDLTQQQVANEMGLSQRTVSREQTKALSRLKALLSRVLL